MSKNSVIISFETFRRFSSWDKNNLSAAEPSVFNGNVSIWKYRITVEQIEEPVEVLQSRLRKLWERCDNHHHWEPLKRVAKLLGITLSHDAQDRWRKLNKKV